MIEVTWTTDQHGRLLGARVHDAGLVAFGLDEERRLSVAMRRLSGDLARVFAAEVREMAILDLWDGGIVSTLYAWRASAVPEATWAVPGGGWNALFRGRASHADARRMAAEIAARRPEPWLFQMELSYGGTLVAVCDDLRVFEDHQTESREAR